MLNMKTYLAGMMPFSKYTTKTRIAQFTSMMVTIIFREQLSCHAYLSQTLLIGCKQGRYINLC